MIGVPGALLIAFLMLLLLLLVSAEGWSAARQLSSTTDVPLFEDGAEPIPCPPEFVSRIFSSDDSEFVASTRSPQLRKLFRRERKLVALLWVQQISLAVRGTMREHARVARGSEDLEFATEMKLFALYVQLLLVCGILFVAIQCAGPLWLRGLAIYADAHSHRFAQVQQSFKAATASRELQGVGSP